MKGLYENVNSIRNSNRLIISLTKKITITVICIVEAIFIGLINKSESYNNLYLLPLSYAVAINIFMPSIKKNCIYKRGLAYYLAQIVILYRSLIVPLACLYTEYFGGWTAHGTNGFGIEPQEASKSIAILWMCSETIFAELAIYIGTRITYRMSLKNKWIARNLSEPTFLRTKAVLNMFVVAAFLLLIVFQRQLFSQFMVLSSNYSAEDNAVGGSFFAVIFLAFRFGFLLIGYSLSAKAYKKNNNKFWIITAMLFLVVYIGYSVGVSRWMLILPVLASIDIFKNCFKPFPVSFAVAIGIVAAIGMFSVSFYKFGYLLDDSGNMIRQMIVLVFQQSNEYISGPRSVAQGLETLNNFGDKVHLSTLFNSMFSGFAGFASMTVDSDKLQSFFNFYNLGVMEDRPLICPIIIEGLAFCPIFPWIFSMLFEIGVCVLDFMSSSHNRYEFRFIYSYLGLWFSLCFCVNSKIEMSQISLTLPCLFLLWVNTKFCYNKYKR